MRSLKLPTVRKPPAIKRVRKVKKLATPARIRNEPLTAEMSDKEKRAYYNLCGEPEERKKIVDRFSELLETEPAITLPEAILYYELEKRKRQFFYQTSLEGGRTELGGMVVDFIIDFGGTGLGVLVNGDFWHSKPEQRMRDLETRIRVIGMEYQGLIITDCLEIWESVLMSCMRDEAISALLQGIEWGRL